MLRFEDLRVRDTDRIDRDFLNRRLRLIAESLSAVSDEVKSVSTDSDNLVTLGLSRLNEVLGPALQRVQAAAENGFLVAFSNTPLTLAVDLETTIQIVEGTGRSLFSPTPHVIITRDGGALDDWAIFEVDTYNRENGGLAGRVLSVAGDIGDAEFSDWVISDSAGLAVTIINAAASVTNSMDVAEQAASDAAAAAAAAQAILTSGPVSSVNGKTGSVSIGMGDIPSLAAALGGKASSSHGHIMSDISGLTAALAGKAAISHSHSGSDTIDGGTY